MHCVCRKSHTLARMHRCLCDASHRMTTVQIDAKGRMTNDCKRHSFLLIWITNKSDGDKLLWFHYLCINVCHRAIDGIAIVPNEWCQTHSLKPTVGSSSSATHTSLFRRSDECIWPRTLLIFTNDETQWTNQCCTYHENGQHLNWIRQLSHCTTNLLLFIRRSIKIFLKTIFKSSDLLSTHKVIE